MDFSLSFKRVYQFLQSWHTVLGEVLLMAKAMQRRAKAGIAQAGV